MKALVNGVSVEGTPEEIVHYQALMKQNDKVIEYQKFKFDMKKAINEIKSITGRKPIVFGNSGLF